MFIISFAIVYSACFLNFIVYDQHQSYIKHALPTPIIIMMRKRRAFLISLKGREELPELLYVVVCIIMVLFLGTLGIVESLVYSYMLVVMLGKHVEVIGVESDIKVVVIAGLYLRDFRAIKRIQGESILCYNTFTGEVSIGG